MHFLPPSAWSFNSRPREEATIQPKRAEGHHEFQLTPP